MLEVVGKYAVFNKKFPILLNTFAKDPDMGVIWLYMHFTSHHLYTIDIKFKFIHFPVLPDSDGYLSWISMGWPQNGQLASHLLHL